MSKKLPSALSGDFEVREYQVGLFQEVQNQNCLVILPTGLGKTMIAVFLAAKKIEEGDGFILFLAPSKPLCEQHGETLREHLDREVQVITGETHGPSKRAEAWGSSRICVATPHTAENDIREERLSLKECSLMVFDEAHRAVGDYPYVEVCRNYLKTARNPQVLGLTASPGSDFDRLVEVALNLGLSQIAVRSEWSDDIKPYMGQRRIKRVEVRKTGPISRAEMSLNTILEEFLGKLSKYSEETEELDPKNISVKRLKGIQDRLRARLQKERAGYLFHAISLVAAAMKLAHLNALLTTQGTEMAEGFVKKLRDEDTKASSLILNHDAFAKVEDELINARKEMNPKLKKVVEILKRHFFERGNGRAIVFAEYRDTVEFLREKLDGHSNIRAEAFIGQAGQRGMSQEEQKEILEKFRRGEFDTLVSTSIGEEGIDVPATSLVVFYEPVPSAIRRIQRKGRTSRDGRKGEIEVLVMKGTRDEPYYWKSLKGEGRMYEAAYRLKKILEKSSNPVEKLHSLKRRKQTDLTRWSS